MFDAASTALNTKFDVVFALGFVAVPDITFVPPFPPSLVKDIPAGKEPDCNSKVTLPAESNPSCFNFNSMCRTSSKVPNEPADVENTGDASILIASLPVSRLNRFHL